MNRKLTTCATFPGGAAALIHTPGAFLMPPTSRFSAMLPTIAKYAIVVLFAKIFLSILYEYRWYFPANFDSSFLSGRRYTFDGIYPLAFYWHLETSPVSVVLGTVMMLTGGRARFRREHRLAGRALVVLVLLGVVPSGLLMATQAYGGSISKCGFAVLSLLTGFAALATMAQARARRFASHVRWANRCFILLLSPLLLRLVSGVTISLQCESEWTYRINAWMSWLIPLLVYEGMLQYAGMHPSSQQQLLQR